MVHHYPRTFWSLLTLSYAMILGACYAWIESKNWPYAAQAAGTMLLVTFALISISYVGRETTINTKALVGLLDREGKGFTRGHYQMTEVDPRVIPPIPTPPLGGPVVPVVVKAQVEPDPGERNKLIAQNTGELQKVADEARGLRQEIRDARRPS